MQPTFTAKSDPDVVAQVTVAINDLAERYPELRGITVDAEPLDKGIYAQAGGRRITFGVQYTEDEARFEKSVSENSRAGFHPRLDHCTAAEFVIYHEAAHIIDQERDKRPRNELNALTWTGAVDYKELTRYSFYWNGEFNATEALANAFASVHCNGGNESERNIAALLD